MNTDGWPLYSDRPRAEDHLPSALDECLDMMTAIAAHVPAVQPWVTRWVALLHEASRERAVHLARITSLEAQLTTSVQSTMEHPRD